MEGKRSNPAESDDYSVEQTSDRSSEEQTTETLDRQNKDRNKQICDPCFLGRFLRVMAFYMCYVCEKSFCKECFSGHNKSHGFLSLQSESEQLEREIDEYFSYIKNESDAERKKKIMKNNVCVCDYVDTKHGLDENCDITGLTGYANKWWVACDTFNHCIKVFSLRSNVLQRYIRLRSQPRDVTEIIVENKTTEQDSDSCSETAISGTYNKPNRKYLLAVTLPWENLILIIDLGKNPAVIHSKIYTANECSSIDFHYGNIFTVCMEYFRMFPFSVSIISVEGVALKTFQTNIPWSWNRPYITVLNRNIYMTDYYNHRVVCYNDEGRVLHEIRIPWSRPQGICVDRSEDKVYVGSWGADRVYELESDLGRYKPVLNLERMERMKHMEKHMEHMEQHMKHMERMERMEHVKYMMHMKRMESMEYMKYMTHMKRMESMDHMEHMKHMDCIGHMMRMMHMKRMESMEHREHTEHTKGMKYMERMEWHFKLMRHMKCIEHMHMVHRELMDVMEHKGHFNLMRHMKGVEHMDMEHWEHMRFMDRMKRMKHNDYMKRMECMDGMERMKLPRAMCFYSDKLYFGHWLRSEPESHLTVVRLL